MTGSSLLVGAVSPLVTGAEIFGVDFRTSDPEEARSTVSNAFGPHQLQVPPNQTFRARMESVDLGPIGLSLHTYGSDVTLIAPPLQRWYVVCLPVMGGIQIEHRRSSSVVEGNNGVVFLPDDRIVFEHWNADSKLLAVRISRQSLENELESSLSRAVHAPISFDLDLQTAGSAAPFVRALGHLLQEIRSPSGLLDHPATRDQLCQLVMTSLLAGHSHQYSAQLAADDEPGTPRALREAVDLINDRFSERLTVNEIASAVGRSVRSLEASFQLHVGLSPMTFLRQVRLSHAHTALIKSDPHETSVAAIAQRFGFPHAARFAAYYRDQYGAAPSEHLGSRRAS